MWRYELDGRSDQNLTRRVLRVIETAAPEGESASPVGWAAHAPVLWGSALGVVACELAPEVSWLAVAPSLMRALKATGEACATAGGAVGGTQPARFERVVLLLGTDHPLYRALPERTRDVVPPYAWYVRVSNLPGFLRRVTPVLEARLADSAAAGHTGDLKLNFYSDGLHLAFANGRVAAAEPWAEPEYHEAGASFPPLTFLHLLLGHRSLADLERAYPDCRARTEEARVLLDALFPPRPSLVWPVA
jgi:hypothetical protein